MNQTNRICAEEYTVKRGDSFYLIAHKLGVPLRDLLAANANIHPARLMVGDVLCIPREEDDTPQSSIPESNGTAGTPSEETIVPEVSQPETGIMPDPTLSCPETEQYTVEQGQTAADLQLRGLVSRHTLETANPGVNLDQLTPGQTVCVPAENIPCDPVRVQAKIRYSATAADATLTLNEGVGELRFDKPQRAPSPGQAAVFYSGGLLLGGGIIKKRGEN